MQPQVIVTQPTPSTTVVQAIGPFGGGYTQPGTTETAVARAAAALTHLGYPTVNVQLIAPPEVRTALQEQGFQV